MVAVGVTGHRQLPHLKIAALAVDIAMEKIINCFGGESLSVISPLAEGADRLVAERALEKYDVKLIVPLPLEIEDYLLDFTSESSKQSFRQLLQRAGSIIHLPVQEPRMNGYLAAGMYTLKHCDVLLALWDGQPPRGIGGTGQIVAEARKQGKPLVWIKTEHREKEQTEIGVIESRIHYERMPSADI